MPGLENVSIHLPPADYAGRVRRARVGGRAFYPLRVERPIRGDGHGSDPRVRTKKALDVALRINVVPVVSRGFPIVTDFVSLDLLNTETTVTDEHAYEDVTSGYSHELA